MKVYSLFAPYVTGIVMANYKDPNKALFVTDNYTNEEVVKQKEAENNETKSK